MKQTRILLVEDSETDIFLVREVLRHHGINAELSVVKDGAAAQQLIEKQDGNCPDLVILDLNLPRVNGLTLLMKIRQSHWCRHTPVAVLTSSQAPQEREQALTLGAQRFLHKVADWDEFLAIGDVFREMLNPAQHSQPGMP